MSLAAPAGFASNAATLPANTGTIAETNIDNAFSVAQTFSAGILGTGLQKQVFTSSGTFTIPTGITQVKVTVVGGGGGVLARLMPAAGRAALVAAQRSNGSRD